MAYLIEAATDTGKMLPVLLAVLIVIELFEHRLNGRLQELFGRLGRLGPVIGAGVGILPQCGGAVVASELYSARALTLGTLLAVYLATSDEALPVLAANPDKLAAIGPLILTKAIIGLVVGYAIDIATAHQTRLGSAATAAGPGASPAAAGNGAAACHGHDAGRGRGAAYEKRACLEGRLTLPELVWHALRRCLRIAVFLAATTATLSWASDLLATMPATASLLSRTSVQVLASASFGLVPSCAPSVAITDLFVKGMLTYPALIAGLCANAGVGLMVLLHESGLRVTLRVTGLLFLSSVAAGFVLSVI